MATLPADDEAKHGLCFSPFPLSLPSPDGESAEEEEGGRPSTLKLPAPD